MKCLHITINVLQDFGQFVAAISIDDDAGLPVAVRDKELFDVGDGSRIVLLESPTLDERFKLLLVRGWISLVLGGILAIQNGQCFEIGASAGHFLRSLLWTTSSKEAAKPQHTHQKSDFCVVTEQWMTHAVRAAFRLSKKG